MRSTPISQERQTHRVGKTCKERDAMKDKKEKQKRRDMKQKREDKKIEK